MTIYATGNPVGSTNPKDLIDNAQNLDYLILGPLLSYPDRKGVNRLSWAGIEASFAAAQAQRASDFNAAQAQRAADFTAAQAQRATDYAASEASRGYENPVPYAAGIALTRVTQIVQYNSELYKAKAGTLPWTTTGVWATDSAKLVSVGDATLRQDLFSNAGAGMVFNLSALTGAVRRSIADKLGEWVSVDDFGAIGDGVTDSAPAFAATAASMARVVYAPGDNYVVNLTQANAAVILGMLKRIRVAGFISLRMPSGLVDMTQQVVVNSPDAHRIELIGAAPLSKSATSVVSVSGSAKAYSVTLAISDVSGVSVGDNAIVRDVAGTGDFIAHSGIWKITAVGVGSITVLNTHHAASFPTNTVTSATVVVLKSRVKFAGSDGFRFEGASTFKRFDQIAIEGDWSVSAGTGTMYAHGIIVCAPVITGGADSNNTYVPSGNVVAGPNLGVSGFGEQGIAVSGRGHMIASFVASSSNRKRGWYAEGAHIRCKFSISSGNGEDGYISDIDGAIQANSSIAVGNGLNGFWCFNNSYIAAPSSRASGNGSNGYECRGIGRISAELSKSVGNAAAGYSASNGGTISGTTSEASSNASTGYDASSNGTINGTSSTAQNNGGHGYRGQANSVVNATGANVSGNALGNYYSSDGSVVFESSGTVSVVDKPTYTVGQRFYDGAKAIYMGLSVSSIGDMTFSSNTIGKWTFKADGVFRPFTDNAQAIGGPSNRASVLYAGTGTINTSDGREKTPMRAFTDAELAASRDIAAEIGAYRFLSAVEEKGDEAREHVGMYVQKAISIMESHGLDPFGYSFICYDQWGDEFDDVPAEYADVDGELIEIESAHQRLVVAAGDRYSFRMDGLSLFISAGQEQRLRKLESLLA
jgi:hypothetical protein